MTSLIGIGAVIDELSEDFPDLTVSKVRFLEAQGLITPVRTPTGYRRYSRDDVARLRYILGAQRDQFLPLRVIKEHVDAMSRGEQPPSASAGSQAEPPRVDPGLGALLGAAPGREVRLTESEILRSSGLDRTTWAEAREQGLVAPDADGSYGAADLQAARALQGLTQYGLSPRHLRSIRLAAERHLGLVDTVVSAGGRDEQESRQTAEAVAVLTTRLEQGIIAAKLRSDRLAGR